MIYRNGNQDTVVDVDDEDELPALDDYKPAVPAPSQPSPELPANTMKFANGNTVKFGGPIPPVAPPATVTIDEVIAKIPAKTVGLVEPPIYGTGKSPNLHFKLAGIHTADAAEVELELWIEGFTAVADLSTWTLFRDSLTSWLEIASKIK